MSVVLARSEASPGARIGTWALWPWQLLLFCVTLLVFAPATTFEFVNLDDVGYVAENQVVRAGFSWRTFIWAFSTFSMWNYHPLTWISYLLDSSLFGVTPVGFHLSSVLLHALSAALCVGAMASLTQSARAGVCTGALFALHPLRAESVAWISERKDVLSGVFFFLLLWLWSEAMRQRRPRLRALALVAFVAGLLSKPMLVSVPPLLLLLDVWPLERRGEGWRALLREKVPWIAVSMLGCGVTIAAQANAIDIAVDRPMIERIAVASIALISYTSKSFFPVNLSPFYWASPTDFSIPLQLSCGLLVIAAFYVAVRLRPRFPATFVGLAWFVGMLVPVLGLVRVGGAWMADRYTYLPQMGLLLIVGDLFARVSARGAPARLLALVGAGAAVVLLAAATEHQLGVWQSSRTLWERAVSLDPVHPIANHNLAGAALREGDKQEGLRRATLAARVSTDPEIQRRFAGALMVNGHMREAERVLLNVVADQNSDAAAWLLLAELARAGGRSAEAQERFAHALSNARRAGQEGIAAQARAGLGGAAVLTLPD